MKSPAEKVLRLNRVLVAVGGGAYLGWWLFVHLALPRAYNPFASRAAVVACFFVALAASYVWPAVARRLELGLALCCSLATIHYFYLYDRNPADLNWMVGSYITVMAACAVLQSERSLQIYAFLVAVLSVLLVLRRTDIPYIVFLPGMLTILAFAYIGLHGRLRLLDELQESHQRFEGLFDAGFEGVAVHERGVVREVNEALTRLIGVSRDELIGRDLNLFLSASGGAPVNDAAVDPGPVEAELRGREGRRVVVEVMSKPHVQGGQEMTLVAIRDLTERKRAESALLLSNRELETFSYTVAHDLRTPLRGITGFGHILLEDYGPELPPDAQDHLKRICQSAEAMGQLIDALLDLSRLSKAALRREPVDLGPLAEATVRRLQATQPERPVEFVNSVHHQAYADPTLLGAVLENLLANAWKFTGSRAPARIEVGSAEENAGLVYFVQDNGAGFDMAYAGKLFAPFQRLHKVSEFPGTGVGLATVERIISRHGGRIWAEGKVDQGATFYFTLPDAPPVGDVAGLRSS